MNRPRPSEVDLERNVAPFVGCFRRMEAEALLALVVLACRKHGDEWRPHPVTVVADEFMRLAQLPHGEAPSWVSFMAAFGKLPDEPTAIAGGWLKVTEAEDGDPRKRVFELTDGFFQRIADAGLVRGAS